MYRKTVDRSPPGKFCRLRRGWQGSSPLPQGDWSTYIRVCQALARRSSEALSWGISYSDIPMLRRQGLCQVGLDLAVIIFLTCEAAASQEGRAGLWLDPGGAIE